MVSSPGFVSNPSDFHALFRLAFASPSGGSPLSWPLRLTRRLILRKARRQAHVALRLVVSKRFQVLFHSPRRGSFHLSLTVLVHYRSPVYLALGGGPPCFRQDFTCPALLRIPLSEPPLRDSHPVSCGFPATSRPSVTVGSYNPDQLAGRFGLLRFRSPLLAECFLFLGLLRCFTSPGSPPCG